MSDPRLCATCKWFATSAVNTSNSSGFCHRNPATQIVLDNYYCGEHRFIAAPVEEKEPKDSDEVVRCDLCKWWRAADGKLGQFGQCRKGLPVVRRETYESPWPTTKADDSCGSFKPNRVALAPEPAP